MREHLLYLSVVVLFAGCKSRTYSSQKGYFENSSPEDFKNLLGKLMVAAEYEPTKSVLLSSQLQRSDYTEAIKKAGASVVEIKSDNVWSRDWSPIVVRFNGNPMLAEFNYYPERKPVFHE
jgi:hypothetical protein